MIVEFDIPKRLYDDLKNWCEINNTDINKYVSLKIRGALTLDKFGDLNEKVKKKQKGGSKEEKHVETQIQSDDVIPVIPMSPPDPETTFAVETENTKKLEQNGKNIEEDNPNEEENQPKEKKRRTLKTK